jgi:hypothetical protein
MSSEEIVIRPSIAEDPLFSILVAPRPSGPSSAPTILNRCATKGKRHRVTHAIEPF